MKKAVVYARVSSKEQEKGFSIEAQLKLIREYCLNNELEAVKEFIDVETAKRAGRSDFGNMLKFLKQEKINIIVVEKTDRLYRNFKDYVILEELDLEIHLVKEGQVITKKSHSHEKLVHGLKVLLAKNFIDNLKEETTKGMIQALSSGYWTHKPPLGYNLKRETSGKKSRAYLVPNDKAFVIRFIFNHLAKDIYSQEEVRRLTNSKFNLNIPRQSFSKIIRNQTYVGMIVSRMLPSPTKGIHVPIISDKLFWAVQNILDRKTKQNSIRIKDTLEFPLRGFVHCAKCGRPLTGSWSKGQFRRYPYYRCLNPGCRINIARDRLEFMFYEELKRLRPNPRFLKMLIAVIEDVYNSQVDIKSRYQRDLEKQIDRLMKKKVRLTDLMIDGEIDSETYKETFHKVKVELAAKQSELEEVTAIDRKINEKISFVRTLLSNFPERWLNSNRIEIKQKLQELIFPQGLIFDGNAYRTPETNIIFNHLDKINVTNVKDGTP